MQLNHSAPSHHTPSITGHRRPARSDFPPPQTRHHSTINHTKSFRSTDVWIWIWIEPLPSPSIQTSIYLPHPANQPGCLPFQCSRPSSFEWHLWGLRMRCCSPHPAVHPSISSHLGADLHSARDSRIPLLPRIWFLSRKLPSFWNGLTPFRKRWWVTLNFFSKKPFLKRHDRPRPASSTHI